MATFELGLEQVFRSGHVDFNWVDDITEYQCTRCNAVMFQHYISNCEHKFCANCKRVLGDGSKRWRCPECHEFIIHIERQDVEFRNKVFQLQVHCPNWKYECMHICTLQKLKCHVDQCNHTKGKILSAPYKGGFTPQMLQQLLTVTQNGNRMRVEIEGIKQTIKGLKITPEENLKKDNNLTDETVWDLSVDVNQIRLKMAEKEVEQQIQENELARRMTIIDSKINGCGSDFHVETTRINQKIDEHVSDLNSKITKVEDELKLNIRKTVKN